MARANPFLGALAGAFGGYNKYLIDKTATAREDERLRAQEQQRQEALAWQKQKENDAVSRENERRTAVIAALHGMGATPDEATAGSLDPTVSDIIAKKYAAAPKPVAAIKDYEGGKAQFNPDGSFDKWVVRPEKEKETTPMKQLAQDQRTFQRVERMAGDYRQDDAITQAKKFASAYKGIEAASKSNDPQSNLAMMYEAVKMRDPNAVREGELALQAKARSIPTWIHQLWNKAATGNVLSDNERQLIVSWAGQKIQQQQELVRPIQKRFGEQARRWGVSADSSYIAPDPIAGITLRNLPHKDY